MRIRPLTMIALIIVAAVVARPALAADKKPLNILMIISDDMTPRLHAMGYGFVHTPNLDKLASRGVLFDRAYCQFPLCAPSRASFMTGRRPDSTTIYDLHDINIRKHLPGCVPLPQLFMDHGYLSARVGKIYHYGVPYEIGTNGSGDDPGSWNIRINPAGIDVKDEWSIINYMPHKGKHPDGRPSLGAALSWRADDGGDLVQTDGKIATQVIQLLKENKDKPFFIGCGFFRPHVPDVIPKEYLDLYPMDEMKLPDEPADYFKQIPRAAFHVWPPNYGITPDKLRTFMRAYYAAMSFADAQVGRVIDTVDQLGIADHTVIVFFADHGWMLGEHGQWMKQDLFELSAKVPCIIVAPGMARGKRCMKTVELVDLYRTLADLAGLKAPDVIEGHSLVPLLKNPDDAAWSHPAFTQQTRRVGRGKDRHEIMGYSIRTDRYRYTEWGKDGVDGVELYDYQADPHELHNLAHDDAAADVRTHLKTSLHLARGR